MEDEGNTVCFSKKWGIFVENDLTGEMIYFERRGGTYVMKLKVKKTSWDKKGEGIYKKTEEMEVDANEEMEDDEEAESEKRVKRDDEVRVLFRRLMLD